MTIDGPEREVYDRLWAEASERLARGDHRIDHHLLRREDDRRAGITLILRPGAETIGRVGEWIEELRGREPEQYFYRPKELHVTVLTLVSASETFDLERTPLARYRTVLAEVFARRHPFGIGFRGITASPDAVLIQGFAEEDSLNRLRKAVRQSLSRAGLADGLDLRYRIVTAHATFMRFAAPLRDPAQLAARLREARTREFGRTVVERIDFVANDWYMAEDRVEALATYLLAGT